MRVIFAALYDFDVATSMIRALAVVGGAVLGGLGTSGLTGLLVRLTTTKKMPGKVRWTLRSLGGLVVGWLLSLMLFGGGGGWGLGGPGGWGVGGTGDGTGTIEHRELPSKDTPPSKDGGNPISSPSTELRIEVLGDPALSRIQTSGKPDPKRCYRIDGEKPSKLRTLSELKQLVGRRLDQQPALKRIELVLYTDSPGRKVGRVAELEEWLDEQVIARKDPNFSYNVNDKVPTEAPVR